MNLLGVFWAGVGYDSAVATQTEATAWQRTEAGIKRLLEKCEEMGIKHVPNEEHQLCHCRQYFLRGDPGKVPTFADFHQVIGDQLFRIGFGFIAHTEAEARGLLEKAESFLDEYGVYHRNISVWWCHLPQRLEIKRLI